MKTSSAKAKGRNLQKHVVSQILSSFNSLSKDDVSSRSMGAGGEDILLSQAARSLLPVSFECKSHAKYAVYKDYEQAKANASSHEPILVIKQNKSQPLALMDLEFFLRIMYENQEAKKPQSNC